MSPELKEALHAWYDWATNDCPQGTVFSRGVGLCSNMGWVGDSLQEEIEGIFQIEFGHLGEHMVLYPFNNGSQGQYSLDICCENPTRLAWVRSKLGIPG
jgi:hypothetical protein